MAALTSLDMSADQAQAVIEAAKAKALELGTKMDIAVVDAGANLKAFLRMDDAWIGSIDIAIKKARTARFFNMPTGEIGKLSQPGGALYNIEHSNGGLISFPGGVPITDSSGGWGPSASRARTSTTITPSPKQELAPPTDPSGRPHCV